MLTLLSALLCSANAFAINERLSFSQAFDGTITITLDGETPYCGIGVAGQPAVTISGTTITLVSGTQVGECPNPPPGFVFPPPTPYTYTTNVGHLSDGTYHIDWGFADPGGHIFQSVSSTFVIVHAGLVASVPALSRAVLVALAAMLAASGIAGIGPRPGA